MAKTESNKLRAVVAIASLIAGLGVVAHIKNSDPARIAEAAAYKVAKAETDRVAGIEREQRQIAQAEAKRVADIKYAADQAERAAKRAAEKAEAERIAALPIAQRAKGDEGGYRACMVAQDHIEQFLRAPATAKWENCYYARGKLEGNVYTILTYVDAQNGFGALIRSSFIVKVDGNGKEWQATGTPKQVR